MNIFADFTGRIAKIVQAFDLKDNSGALVDTSRITVEPPRDASHGDLATNAAMVLAKPAGQNPRALADRIVAELVKDADVERADVAGPGFVNLKLKDEFWRKLLVNILEQGADFGRQTAGRRQEGQCRICLGQPDRADACRPLPGRGRRRHLGQYAGLCRL